MAWINRNERMPPAGRDVMVIMDAKHVGNPQHPGYQDGRWEMATRRMQTDAGEPMDCFVCELMQTGTVTHWLETPPMPARSNDRIQPRR